PNRRNFGEKGDTLAAILSQLCEEAVLVRYDSGTCYRYSALYRGGKLVHQYTLADELWIPLDSEGNPVLAERAGHSHEQQPGLEYETLKNAVQLGLEEVGYKDWHGFLAVISQL